MIWASCHINYDWTSDDFVSKGLFNFLSEENSKLKLQKFFFIRYFENGPHFRLRFLIEETSYDYLKQKLEEYFFRFIENNPDSLIYKNNKERIKFTKYIPEIERYGGEYSIKIAEDQFYLSSKTVLKLLKNSRSYSDKLSIAINMHIAFCFAIDLNKDQSKIFFGSIYHQWLPRLQTYIKRKNSKNFITNDEVVEIFKHTFERQSDEISSYIDEYWSSLQANGIDSEAINKWVIGNRSIHKNMLNLQNAHKLAPILYIKTKDDEKENVFGNIELLNIYTSFVHMTNNRLGISNQDESYLGYILKESL